MTQGQPALLCSVFVLYCVFVLCSAFVYRHRVSPPYCEAVFVKCLCILIVQSLIVQCLCIQCLIVQCLCIQCLIVQCLCVSIHCLCVSMQCLIVQCLCVSIQCLIMQCLRAVSYCEVSLCINTVFLCSVLPYCAVSFSSVFPYCAVSFCSVFPYCSGVGCVVCKPLHSSAHSLSKYVHTFFWVHRKIWVFEKRTDVLFTNTHGEMYICIDA